MGIRGKIRSSEALVIDHSGHQHTVGVLLVQMLAAKSYDAVSKL